MIRPIHRVRIEPEGLEIQVKDGQTVFRAAGDRAIAWPTRCGGAQSCTLCTMVVIEGTDNLSRPGEKEAFLVAPIARRMQADALRVRMACAAKVRGPLVVEPRYALGVASEQPAGEA